MTTKENVPNVGEMIRSDVPPLAGASEHVTYGWPKGKREQPNLRLWQWAAPLVAIEIIILIVTWKFMQIV